MVGGRSVRSLDPPFGRQNPGYRSWSYRVRVPPTWLHSDGLDPLVRTLLGWNLDEVTRLVTAKEGVIMRAIGLWATLMLALGAVACSEDVDSTDVKTSGVYADMSVVATGDGRSKLTVDLRVGGASSNTHLDVKGTDSLTANDGTTTKTLTQSGNVYTATFDGDAADKKFTVIFNRPDDKSAPNSWVTLPAPFAIAGVAAGATVSRAAGFTATWAASTASTDRMQWTIDSDAGGCLFANSKSISDAGQTVITASDFSVHSGEEQATCNANFCLDRTRDGALDPAYGEGGKINATQKRCVAFMSAP